MVLFPGGHHQGGIKVGQKEGEKGAIQRILKTPEIEPEQWTEPINI